MQTTQVHQALTRLNKYGTGEYYGVLSGAKTVGTKYRFIFEHSFYTNPNMARWMLNNENIEKMAYAEVNVICNYFNVTRSEENSYELQAHTETSYTVVRLKDKNHKV